MFKNILIAFLYFFSFIAVSNEYILEASSKTISKQLKIDENYKYTNIEIDVRWNDSVGEFGIGKCFGNIKTKNDYIILEAFCEAIDSKGDKAFFKINRDKDIEGGTGVSTYLSGTGKYKKLIGSKCVYAVKYYDKEHNFYMHKCKLDYKFN